MIDDSAGRPMLCEMPALKLYHLRDHEIKTVDAARYSVTDTHPEFKNGDEVWVCDILPGGIVRGVIRGVAMRHIVDFWLVDFGAPVSETYPFQCVSVAHGQILKPSVGLLMTT